MDLIVKRVTLSDGRPMFGVCRVIERQGGRVTAWELLHLQTGEPWAFTSFYWADKKRRVFAPESPEYLRRAGIDVPESASPAAENPPLANGFHDQGLG